MQNPGRTLRCALAAITTAALVLGTTTTPATAGPRAADDATLTPRTDFVLAPVNPDASSPRPPAIGERIPNIDSVKATIRAYYGATNTGIADTRSSPYITEVTRLLREALDELPDPAPAADLAIVLDGDDTLLWTYDMLDGEMGFDYDPEVASTWVDPGRFPAIPGMVDFVAEVIDRGYEVYGLTGRPAGTQEATLENLAKVGYEGFDADNLFTRFSAPSLRPGYLDCHTSADPADDPATCTIVEYKAGTRAHLESLGKTIVLNIGDQYSDLLGGHAEETLKLPNPTYYLPSPNIEGAPAGDADLALPTRFTMAPDGSSGRTTPGDRIPNIDNVKAAIRAYYGAVDGVADKRTSPYISQMTKVAKRWKKKLTTMCTRGVKKRQRPAVVFDADDTTLMTYDMEDAAMGFDYDSALQDVWVQESRFPATPRMRGVVAAAAKAGCRIVGLTGRNNAERVATLDNLARYYHDARGNPYFKSAYFFTKWTSNDRPPAYVDCAVDGDPADCSSLDFKASTRTYLRKKKGMRIVANFGDQFSDLRGGWSAHAVKLPNPTYYLP